MRTECTHDGKPLAAELEKLDPAARMRTPTITAREFLAYV